MFITADKFTTPPNWGFSSGPNSLGELVYRRTYRRDEETWADTVTRCVNGTFEILHNHCKRYNLPFDMATAKAEALEMGNLIYNFKFTPPGRGLWIQGTPIVDKVGSMPLMNCAFVSTSTLDKDKDKPFRFLMDVSMLGVGCGFDTDGAGKINWSPSTSSEPLVIDDSREGWVAALGKLLLWGFGLHPKPLFDYSLIRPKGTPIRGFGGVAEGPAPLKDLFADIEKIILLSANRPVSVRNIVDIMNLIGRCVVSGNVRRCLPAGTLIHTDQGMVPIEKIQPGMCAKTSTGYARISELVEQGTQSLWTVRTQLGNFEATSRHQMAVMTSIGSYEWKRLNELKAGDRLVFVATPTEGLATDLPAWRYEKPEHSTTCKDLTLPHLDEDLAWFLGLFHGDGYTYANRENNGFNAYVSIACDASNKEIIAKASEQMERFGVLVKQSKTINENCVTVRSQSKQLAWYLDQHFKQPKTSIRIPNWILQGTAKVRAAYLAGVFDADGSQQRPLVVASTVYPEFLKDLQALLASLGIPSRTRLHRQAQGNWQTLWHLNLVGEKALSQWNRLIAAWSLKYKSPEKNKRSQNDYGYPADWVKKEQVKFSPLWSPSSEQMTVATAERCGVETKNLIPIKVLEILPDTRTAQTYDIAVPGPCEFVAQEGLLVHNTAEISFGSPDDPEYLDLKNYEKNPDRASYGWTSNNSVYARLGMDYSAIAERTRINGEPGYFWLENARDYGRMGKPADHKDYRVKGSNPCVEQLLESYEVCNLNESYLPHHKSLEDFKKTLKYAFLYSKAITLLPTHWAETNAVQLRNRRIGTSLSGVAQFLANHSKEELIRWLEEGYETVEKYDRIYSEWLGVRESIRKTSIKPSGTVSLLAGCTPGCHYPIRNCYIRRVRYSAHHPDLKAIIAAGYHTEPMKMGDREDSSTIVVEFPVLGDTNVKTVNEVSAKDQMEVAALLQKHWADNSVSVTVTFDPVKEGKQLPALLKEYEKKLKAVSFLPALEEGAYPQMPYESISLKKYQTLTAKIKPIRWSESKSHDMNDVGCDGVACEIQPLLSSEAKK